MIRILPIISLTLITLLALLWPALSSATLPVTSALQTPWTCSQEHSVSQGNHGSTHNGWGRYAWDFNTPEGTTITAPDAGEVRKVRDDSTSYGCDSSYAWDANYVVISMDNGFDVLLLHLQADSVIVEEGQQVIAGQPLAKVGNSGWVCGTHLHLQVQRRCSNWWCPSVPAEFADLSNPTTGTALQSVPCEIPEESHATSAFDHVLWRIISLILPRFPATPLL